MLWERPLLSCFRTVLVGKHGERKVAFLLLEVASLTLEPWGLSFENLVM